MHRERDQAVRALDADAVAVRARPGDLAELDGARVEHVTLRPGHTLYHGIGDGQKDFLGLAGVRELHPSACIGAVSSV